MKANPISALASWEMQSTPDGQVSPSAPSKVSPTSFVHSFKAISSAITLTSNDANAPTVSTAMHSLLKRLSCLHTKRSQGSSDTAAMPRYSSSGAMIAKEMYTTIRKTVVAVGVLRSLRSALRGAEP
eukprot:CAMPEP_0172914506 /NCGR_PEP_ID=MMETSP1075-20121228/192534_1 /TAXON_ID=2916 /ORGANISM="Ceratium fusus, Strain PA161109" /LENGTH=126 /DNA_ID=CAMNT_0013773437 /DNA_START=730 /DNA_END=1107 /DNA_ORIENTATION=+